MKGIWLSGLLVSAAACLPAYGASGVDEIKRLLDLGQDKTAYELAKNSPDALGDPLFDFYFGIAAVNAGNPGEGVLALERYLAHFPNNRSARFQLARGYFILGEDLRSKEEFEPLMIESEVLESHLIQDYLDAIRVRSFRHTPIGQAYVEFSVGHDTNINSGVSAGPVPGMTPLTITSGSTEEREPDNFAQMTVGGHGTYPVAPGVVLYGAASLAARSHLESNNSQFNFQHLGLQGGVHLLSGRHHYRAGLDLSQLQLDHQSYLAHAAVIGEWQYQPDQFNRWGLAGSFGRFNYQDVNAYTTKTQVASNTLSNTDLNDSLLSNLSATWTRYFEFPWIPVWTNQVHVGRDRNSKNRPDLSKHIWGVKTGLSFRPQSRWLVAGHLGYQNQKYQAEYATGLPNRKDEIVHFDLMASYRLTRQTWISGHVYSENQRSNINRHDVQRQVYWVKVRHEFN